MRNPSISALRAISAIILKRLLHPLEFMAIILLVAAWVFTILLSVAFSPWWLLLLIVILPLTLIVIVAKVISMQLIQVVLPRPLTDKERSQVLAFSDKLL